MRFTIVLAALISTAIPIQSSPVDDLRVFLKNHSGQSPIRLKVSGEFRQVEERRDKPVEILPSIPVKLTVSENASGFQVSWDLGALTDATERNPAEDLGMTIPNLAHRSTEWLDPICLSRTTNPVRSLQRLLDVAKVKEILDEPWKGKPAQRLVLGFKSPVPKRYRDRANTTDGTLTIWVAPDGAPLASEVVLRYQGRMGRFFGDFSRFTLQKTTYKIAQDRVFSASQVVEDRIAAEWDITRTVLSLAAEEEKP